MGDETGPGDETGADRFERDLSSGAEPTKVRRGPDSWFRRRVVEPVKNVGRRLRSEDPEDRVSPLAATVLAGAMGLAGVGAGYMVWGNEPEPAYEPASVTVETREPFIGVTFNIDNSNHSVDNSVRGCEPCGEATAATQGAPDTVPPADPTCVPGAHPYEEFGDVFIPKFQVQHDGGSHTFAIPEGGHMATPGASGDIAFYDGPVTIVRPELNETQAALGLEYILKNEDGERLPWTLTPEHTAGDVYMALVNPSHEGDCPYMAESLLLGLEVGEPTAYEPVARQAPDRSAAEAPTGGTATGFDINLDVQDFDADIPTYHARKHHVRKKHRVQPHVMTEPGEVEAPPETGVVHTGPDKTPEEVMFVGTGTYDLPEMPEDEQALEVDESTLSFGVGPVFKSYEAFLPGVIGNDVIDRNGIRLAAGYESPRARVDANLDFTSGDRGIGDRDDIRHNFLVNPFFRPVGEDISGTTGDIEGQIKLGPLYVRGFAGFNDVNGDFETSYTNKDVGADVGIVFGGMRDRDARFSLGYLGAKQDNSQILGRDQIGWGAVYTGIRASANFPFKHGSLGIDWKELGVESDILLDDGDNRQITLDVHIGDKKGFDLVGQYTYDTWNAIFGEPFTKPGFALPFDRNIGELYFGIEYNR